MEESSRYESPHIGENDTLPQVLKIQTFIAARGKEVQLMKTTLGSKMMYVNKLAFQKLPTHMRRRVMSHKVKRLPRRLREIHKNQLAKSGLPQKTRRPSRKYIRRPYNLTNEYVRRQRRIIWLDTHIWHAKRFHMVEKWGYRLPYKPCDRAFRACYRATKNHCLLQDISYFRCVEITGDYNKIVDRFKKITNSKDGLTIGANIYAEGKKEGTVFVYKFGTNKEVIGQVSFLWKTPEISDSKRILWTWLHPAYYKEVLDTFVKCFCLDNCMEVDTADSNKMYFNDEIELSELNNELSRFRLTGPLSTAVLQNCFVPFQDNIEEHVDWIDAYKKKYTHVTLNDQVDVWKDLKHVSSITQIPPHTIISLVVRDPRYHFPKKRTKSLPEYDNNPHFNYDSQRKVFASPIWDVRVRVAVKHEKLSNFKITQLRQQLLVPGTDLEDPGLPVPVILIQRPGLKTEENRGYGHGWDIILPGGWAQPFWISLIMWGARSGGLRETNSVAFEMGQNDLLDPDTDAGVQNEIGISNKCKETYFRRPPNKRTNYNKFNISSPLSWNWKLLISEWHTKSVDNFFVLRDKSILRNIQELINSKTTTNYFNQCGYNCLVPVRITVKKGLLKKFAIICLPNAEDYKKEPREPKAIDILQQKRRDLRREHKQLLKRLRKRRIRAKKNGKEIPIDTEMLANYTKQMRNLWLPQPRTIRKSCSREVIGFVKFGDFSFSLGQSCTVGYITIGSLSLLLKQKYKDKILLRNNNSLQYRIGTLQIICD